MLSTLVGSATLGANDERASGRAHTGNGQEPLPNIAVYDSESPTTDVSASVIVHAAHRLQELRTNVAGVQIDEGNRVLFSCWSRHGASARRYHAPCIVKLPFAFTNEAA